MKGGRPSEQSMYDIRYDRGIGRMAYILRYARKGRDTPKDTPAPSAYFSASGT